MRTTLLVEDVSFFEKAIVAKLREVGRNQVMVARTYEEAENCLNLPIGEPDLALVDLTLPDAANGEIVDLCRKRNIPTIVFTGRFDAKIRQKVLEKGVIDYVLKDTPGSLNYVADLLRRLTHNPGIGVLILDDSSVERQRLADVLSHHLYRVHQASSSSEALRILEHNPDIKLVLADYFMPDEDGFSFLKTVRRKYDRESLAVIGMSSFGSPENRVRFLKYGAADFIDKNYSQEEILLRVSLNLDTIYRIQELNTLAMRDSLTGLYNRHFLFGQGARTISAWRHDKGRAAWLAVFDLDGFKAINDDLGHAYGDAVLSAFAKQLNALATEKDFVTRLGGDEFCIVFRSLSKEDATSTLADFLDTLPSNPVRYREKDVPIRTSVGLAQIIEGNLADALRAADKNLYSAKRSGRGRLVAKA